MDDWVYCCITCYCSSYNPIAYIASFIGIVGNPLLGKLFATYHRQGISLSPCLKTWIDFEKTCGTDRN